MPEVKLKGVREIVGDSVCQFGRKIGYGSLIGDFLISWFLANGIPSDINSLFESFNLLELAKNFALIFFVILILFIIQNFFTAIFLNFKTIEDKLNQN